MKKIVFLLLITLLLSACSANGANDGNGLTSGDSSGLPSKESFAAKESTVYIPAHTLSLQETIEQFFDQQYNAYAGLYYIDISYLLDMNQARNHNPLVWLETLIQRRKLIAEHQLCYVDTTKRPYTITYENEAKDERMEFTPITANRRSGMQKPIRNPVILPFIQSVTGQATAQTLPHNVCGMALIPMINLPSPGGRS